MHTSASSGSLSGRRREPRLTYLLRPTDAAVHISGVNALAVSPDGKLLFSGGRDASVRRWQAGEDAAAASAGGSHGCFEGHTDWVTALAWVGPSLLCSASCDTTLRLWRSDAESPPGEPPASAAPAISRVAGRPACCVAGWRGAAAALQACFVHSTHTDFWVLRLGAQTPRSASMTPA